MMVVATIAPPMRSIVCLTASRWLRWCSRRSWVVREEMDGIVNGDAKAMVRAITVSCNRLR
jgi:hypothetical protein